MQHKISSVVCANNSPSHTKKKTTQRQEKGIRKNKLKQTKSKYWIFFQVISDLPNIRFFLLYFVLPNVFFMLSSVWFLIYEGEMFAHTAGGDFMPHAVTVHIREVTSCVFVRAKGLWVKKVVQGDFDDGHGDLSMVLFWGRKSFSSFSS
ncbi:hypothetical protein AABB24_036898 [Solanum stoloniferum]|uniref:Transmembrane protein n=1 Tax=Solanum stoloniferum TaxID=62892 RepID=A0ABD2R257_9SOLN